MKTTAIICSALIFVLGGCSLQMNPEKHAQRFFDEGRDQILTSLKRQDLATATIETANATITRHEKAVTSSIAATLRQQRKLLHGITSGQGADRLVALESDLHTANVKAAQAIGGMHDELAKSVGENAWQLVTARLDKRAARHFGDR